MLNTRTQKIIAGATILIVVALVLATIYKMKTKDTASYTETETPTTTQSDVSDKFGGASPEELEELLNSIAPTDGSGGMTDEEIAAALADLRKGEESTKTEPDATPEGEVHALTEAEIQARLQNLEEDKDDTNEITPE